VTVQGDSVSPRLPKAVDLALVVDTYHHIPNRVAYFTKLKESLKPGGTLAIVDFRKDAPSGPPAEFRFTPDQESVEDMGQALGVSYEDNEELKGSDKVIERDKHRWELDPASADDYEKNRE